ncbi:MAG: hypothetical protein AAFQ80_04850, partial [Cyanobacteria bacterium J06621_8]
MKLQFKALSLTLGLVALLGACTSVKSGTPDVSSPESVELEANEDFEDTEIEATEGFETEELEATEGFEVEELEAAEDIEDAELEATEG